MLIHQFKEVATLLPLRRTWIAIRALIDEINSFFDLNGGNSINQRVFMKQVINAKKFNSCLHSMDGEINKFGYFVHIAQVEDRGDVINCEEKRRYFMYITSRGETPPPFYKQS